VRKGKARINNARCVDCGECIKACPNRAKSVITDDRSVLEQYKYKVCLPAPSFFGQFRSDLPLGRVIGALKQTGFSHVFEVSVAADLVAQAIAKYVEESAGPFPLISTSCPAVVRLVQVRFPDLIPHLVPFEAPMEVAAYLAREEVKAQTGCSDEEIGVFFTTPCPAKVTAVHQPVGQGKSYLNGAFSMADVYADTYRLLPSVQQEEAVRGTARGLSWARSGGEGESIVSDDYLAVDGMNNVIAIFEELELGRLRSLKYIEGQACYGGCVGGVLVVENPFIARVRVARLSQRLDKGPVEEISVPEEALALRQTLHPRPFLQLDSNVEVALQKLNELESLVDRLPMLDCGACGAPHCRALAEDIVRGVASLSDCVILLRSRIAQTATQEKAGQQEEGDNNESKTNS